MNQKMGKKWFIFYTKIRPWITCIAFTPTLEDFIKYTSVYLNNWWLILSFVSSIVSVVLGIMVFTKSSGDYEEFVKFVKKVILYETISMTYHLGLNNYLENFSIPFMLVTCTIGALVYYFLWYRLNVNYFEKRLIKHDILDNRMLFPDKKYCSNCGKELTVDSRFCFNCGAQITE